MADSSPTRKQIRSRPSRSQFPRRSSQSLTAPLARLKVAHKLLIFGAVLAVPIVLLLHSVVSGYDEEIRYTRNELEGAL